MGAGGVIIILKAVKSALQVGVTRSGNPKLWHLWLASLVAAWALGKWF